MFLAVCIFENLIHVFLSKAEVLIQVRGGDRIGDKVIRTREDAFLGDAQAASDHSKTQGVIILQCRTH